MFEDQVEPLAYDLAFWMQAIENPEYPLGELGKLSLEVSAKFRAMAIMAILTAASTDGFYHNLMRSALVRLDFLKKVKAADARDLHHYASGRYHSLIDAIAANDFASAQEIAELSPGEWQGRREYQDDYCFARLITGIVSEAHSAEDTKTLFKQYSDYLDGNSDARLDVVKALYEKDPDQFSEAFENLLQQREEQIATSVDRAQIETPEVMTERRIYVEGLAMLRLAEKVGITTEADYRYCPSTARQPIKQAFPGA